MSRTDIYDRGFVREKADLLLRVYDTVWAELEPQSTSGNSQKVQRAISTSLIRKASDTPLDSKSLHAYALDRAARRLTSA
jgi:hypothetical protein